METLSEDPSSYFALPFYTEVNHCGHLSPTQYCDEWNHLVSVNLHTKIHEKLLMLLIIKVDKLLILCLENTYNEGHLCIRV